MHREPAAFTIGHSNQAMATFLSLLKQHGIEVLVDVRSQPHSKYATQFDANALNAAVTEEGIKYIFMGREIGGRPQGSGFYDDEEYVLYDRMAKSSVFLEGIARLERGIRQYRVAVMCSEEDPTECHRHLLIARVLKEDGIEVRHIRGDGRIQTDEDLDREEKGDQPESSQLSFFEDERPKEKPWKSTRSVLRKEVQPPSSET